MAVWYLQYRNLNARTELDSYAEVPRFWVRNWDIFDAYVYLYVCINPRETDAKALQRGPLTSAPHSPSKPLPLSPGVSKLLII